MGLYLCAFDHADNELDGVEVGSYADFNFFRDAVAAAVESGQAGSLCPVLQNHPDSEGEWSVDEAKLLIKELDLIESTLVNYPPTEFNSAWKGEVAKLSGIAPTNLLDCFFDVDGESLVSRLRGLAEISVKHNAPILFQ